MFCENGVYQTELGSIPCSSGGMTEFLYNTGLSLIGLFALVFIIYGGYLILTSGGNPEQVAKGRSYINYAIIGILLAVGGFAFYQVVVLNVLKIPLFTR